MVWAGLLVPTCCAANVSFVGVGFNMGWALLGST